MQAEVTNQFSQFGVSANLLKALDAIKFTEPTEIQKLSLPILMKEKGDFIALATTGSGKTGAFGIPLIESIQTDLAETQGLILCPTRELAIQVSDQIQKIGRYNGIRVATIFGGAPYYTQAKSLKSNPHIIVATPGRLIDFLEKGDAQLENVKVIILDEADKMISMGFQEEVESILAQSSKESQKWLFSATMDREMRKIADRYLVNPRQIAHTQASGLSETIEQIYMTVKIANKMEAICRFLQVSPEFYGIIFCQTKNEVAQLSDRLNEHGFQTEALHGDRTQNEREVVLRKFRNKQVKILVATDVAARGLDISDLTHVINHSLPWDVESYIHRVGRTGRNGQKGTAITLVSPDQIKKLARIQKVTKSKITRAPIPTAEDVVMTKINHVLESALQINADDVGLQKSEKLVREITKAREILWDAYSAEELVARMISKEIATWLKSSKQDLDFLPPDRVPDELQDPSERRRDFSGDRRGPRGGFEGRRDFRGGRGEGRPSFGRRDDRRDDRRDERRDDRRDDRSEGRSERSEGRRSSYRAEGRSERPERRAEGRPERRSEGRPSADRPVKRMGDYPPRPRKDKYSSAKV
ncbi:MAG: RNA helicase [Oligoflexia bacterium]|nr:MAG: RNA helicase [Oligoflexia bacterium]